VWFWETKDPTSKRTPGEVTRAIEIDEISCDVLIELGGEVSSAKLSEPACKVELSGEDVLIAMLRWLLLRSRMCCCVSGLPIPKLLGTEE
jgi:hypothetical protein